MLEDPRTADRLMQEAQTAESIARNPVADPDAAPPVIVLPDDWEIDPELEFEGSASTHPSGGPSANDKVNMRDGTGEQARISEAHSSADEEIDFSSFSRVEDALKIRAPASCRGATISPSTTWTTPDITL
jgi:hypothetical protein